MEMKIEDFNAVIKEVIVAHKYKYERGALYGYNRGRKSYGLIYLISGELEYTFLDGRNINVRGGDMFLLKPSDAYKVVCREECLHYTVNFKLSASSIKGNIAKNILLSDSVPIINQPPHTNYNTDTLEELSNVWEQKSAGYEMRALSLVYKLLYGFILTVSRLMRSGKFQKLLPAKEYIEAHWKEKISLSALASVCNMSVTHLRHLFTDAFNTTPIEYRDSIRLLYAKDYLAEEHYTVSEVAYKCGFDDVNYFSRFFKKHTGLSPTEYRGI